MDGLTKTFYGMGALAALSLVVMIAVMLSASVAGLSQAKAKAPTAGADVVEIAELQAG